MKKLYPYLLLLLPLFFYSCAPSGSSTERSSNRSGSEIVVDNPNVGLDEYIGRLNGVRVRGSGSSATVNVRGAASSTIMNDPRPLFIVDGVQVGRDFSRIYGMVSINSVNRLRVIHSSRASILYGHDGSNGVIEIITNE